MKIEISTIEKKEINTNKLFHVGTKSVTDNLSYAKLMDID